MKFPTLVTLAVISLLAVGAGCGPRPLTDAEKTAKAAQKRAHEAADKAKDQRAKTLKAQAKVRAAKEKIAALKAAAAEQAAKRRAKVLTYRRFQLAKAPLPQGVAQLSSKQFLVDIAFARNGRYLCSGKVVRQNNSDDVGNNDVDSIRLFGKDHLMYVCKQPVRKYRDAGFKP